MTTVLNGGAGFLGIAVATALMRAGENVCIIDTERRLHRASAHLGAVEKRATESISHGELESTLKGARALIHLAWSSQPANSMSRIVEDASVNIVGSLELFIAAARAGVQTIAFASSGGTVYGNAETLPIDENLPPNPVSAYGVSKVAVERYLQLAAFHHGFTGISLRIGNPYGPYQLAGTPIGVIAKFIQQLRAGEPLRIYGDGSVVRDYVWIDDVARAVVLAAQQDLACGEYNIGSEIGHSLNEIAELVENAMGIRTSREYVSDRSFDARKVVLSTAKFRSMTGWTPCVSLGEGIARMTRAVR